MLDTSSNFAQPCCDIQDFQAVIYAPDSGAILTLNNDCLMNYECRVQPILKNDAILTIEDNTNIKDLISANTNLWVHIFYVENGEKEFVRRDFRVLNTNTTNTQNRRLISFNLQDSTSYIFSKTFESKTFNSIKKCFDYYYSKYIDNDENWIEPKKQLPGGLDGFRVHLNCVVIGNDNINITIQGNKSFYESFSEELQRNGYIWYQETFVIYIIQVSKLQPDKLPKSDLIYKRYDQSLSNNPLYLYYSRFDEAPKNTQKPKTQAISYDFENKKMNMQKGGIDIDIATEEFDTSIKLEQVTTDNQYYQKYLSYIDTYTGRLVIPTRHNNIQLFKVIRIESHNPKANKDIGDIRDSGYYIITGYTDKVMMRNKLVSMVKVSRF